MPIDPRTLEAIRNPTAGLANIGATFLQAQEMAHKRQVEESKAALDARKTALQEQEFALKKQLDEANMTSTQIKNAKDQANVVGSYNQSVLEQFTQLPDDQKTPENMINIQRSLKSSMPESMQKILPPLQNMNQLVTGLRNAQIAQSWFEDKVKPTEELVSIQNIDTKQVITRNKADPYIDQLIKSDKWVEYAPSQKGTTEDIGLQKKTIGTIEEQSLKAAEMQDQIAQLGDLFKKGGEDKLNYYSQAYDAMAVIAEKAGIPLSEKTKESVKSRTLMQDQASKLYTNWRLHVTGSQAGKYELQEIKEQPPNMADSTTEFTTKLKLWKDMADKIQVRAIKAQNQGFKPMGTAKINGKEIPTWKNEQTGEIKAISDFGALGAIPTMDEYVDSELERLYPDPSKMSDEEKRKAIEQVNNQARSMGYR